MGTWLQQIFRRKHRTDLWVERILRYLAIRRNEDFQAALESARDNVAEFLEAYKTADIARSAHLGRLLLTSATVTDSEALTVRLIWADVGASSVGSWRHCAPETMLSVQEKGITGCTDAVKWARQLGNKPCLAFYLAGLGFGLSDIGSMWSARDAYETAIAIYRELADSEPEVYQPRLAMTLSNVGTTLLKLNEAASAATALEEALSIYKDLAETKTEYWSLVATALNNLGNVLPELNQKRREREVYEEALAILRELAKNEAEVYQRDLP